MSEERLVKVVVEFEIELEAEIHLEEQDIIGIINKMNYDFTINHSDCMIMETKLMDCNVTIPEDTIQKLLYKMVEYYDERNFQEIMKNVDHLQRFLLNNQEMLDIEPIPCPPKRKRSKEGWGDE
jgi:hypothetical protein